MNELNKRSRIAPPDFVRVPTSVRHLVGLALSLLGLTSWLILPCYASSRQAQSATVNRTKPSTEARQSGSGIDSRSSDDGHLAPLGFNAWSRSGPEGATFTIGLFRPSDNLFFLRNSNTLGAPNITVEFGAPEDLPIVGDWNGNGSVTIGLYRPSSSTFFLRNTNTVGPPDIAVSLGDGPGGDVPVAGDWDGNGTWTIGVYRPGSSTFFLRNSNSFGVPDIEVTFGAPGDMPIVGDWDGNGTMTIGLFRPSGNLFFLRNSNSAAAPDVTVEFGAPGDLPIVGDWDANGTTTIGLFRPDGNLFFLRNSNTLAPPDITVEGFGAPGDMPIVGDWGSNFELQLSDSRVRPFCDYYPYGCDGAIEITVVLLSGPAEPVFLSVQGLPAGAHGFSANPVTPGSISTLWFYIEELPPSGTYRVTVTGTSGTLIRTVSFDLIT